MLPQIRNFLLFILGAFFLALFTELCFAVFISDSELWAVTVSAHWWDNLKEAWIFSRPLFYPYLSISTLLSSDPWAQFMLARGLMLLNVAVLILGLKQLNQKLGYTTETLLFALVILFANTGFLNQGFRIRSDLIAATLSVFSLGLMLNSNRSGLWGLLPVLASPKGLVQVAALLLPRLWKRKPIRLHTLWFVIVLLILVLALPQGRQLLISQWDYFQHTLSGDAGGPGYFTAASFVYVIRQIEANSWFWILLMCKVVLFATSLRKVSASERYVGTVSLLSLVMLFLFPDKTPFFLAAFLPLLAFWTATLFQDFKRIFAASYDRLSLGIAVLSFALIFPAVSWSEKNKNENHNQDQKQAVTWLRAYLQGLGTTSYYDVVGLIPDWAQAKHFLGPHQPQSNQVAFQEMMKVKPHVFLYANKVNFLRPEIDQFLAREYIELQQGVFVRSLSLVDLDPSKHARAIEGFFTLPNPLRYQVNAEFDPHFLIEVWLRTLGQKGTIVRRWSEIQSLLKAQQSAEQDILILKVSPFLPPSAFLEKRFDQLIRFDSDF